MRCLFVFFFFQAEDGIRDYKVTGVQTCALPISTSDSAFIVQPTGLNPRGEYFLLENRQPVQSDSAMIRIHCQVSGNPPFCGGGLLIYHVDAQQGANGTAFGNNSVQNGPIHGLELIQADGLGNLDANPSSAP